MAARDRVGAGDREALAGRLGRGLHSRHWQSQGRDQAGPLISPRLPGSCRTAPPAARISVRLWTTSVLPATRWTAPTSCSPISATGNGRAPDAARAGFAYTRRAAHDDPGPLRPVVPDHRPHPGLRTANVAIYAIAANAEEREARLCKVQLYGQNLPEGACGRTNRQIIADHETPHSRPPTRLQTGIPRRDRARRRAHAARAVRTSEPAVHAAQDTRSAALRGLSAPPTSSGAAWSVGQCACWSHASRWG